MYLTCVLILAVCAGLLLDREGRSICATRVKGLASHALVHAPIDGCGVTEYDASVEIIALWATRSLVFICPSRNGVECLVRHLRFVGCLIEIGVVLHNETFLVPIT